MNKQSTSFTIQCITCESFRTCKYRDNMIKICEDFTNCIDADLPIKFIQNPNIDCIEIKCKFYKSYSNNKV